MRHRVGLALLGELRWLIDLAGDGADRQDACALVPGDQLAALAWADAGEGPRRQDVLLAIDLEDHGALENRVDLFHAVLGVVVLRVLGRVRGELLHLHPERPDAQPGPGAAQPAAEDRLEVVDALDRDVSHLTTLPPEG